MSLSFSPTHVLPKFGKSSQGGIPMPPKTSTHHPHPASSRRARLIHGLLDFFIPLWGACGLLSLLSLLLDPCYSVYPQHFCLCPLYLFALNQNSHTFPYLSVVLDLALPVLTERRLQQLGLWRTLAVTLVFVQFIVQTRQIPIPLYTATLQLLFSVAGLIFGLLVIFYIIFIPIGLYGYFLHSRQKD